MHPYLITGIIGAAIGLWLDLTLLCIASGVMLGMAIGDLSRK